MNCAVIRHSDNAVRIKTWKGSSGSGSVPFSFENMHMDAMRNPVIIGQYETVLSICLFNIISYLYETHPVIASIRSCFQFFLLLLQDAFHVWWFPMQM